MISSVQRCVSEVLILAVWSISASQFSFCWQNGMSSSGSVEVDAFEVMMAAKQVRAMRITNDTSEWSGLTRQYIAKIADQVPHLTFPESADRVTICRVQRIFDNIANLRAADQGREAAHRMMDEAFQVLRYHLLMDGYTAERINQLTTSPFIRAEPQDTAGLRLVFRVAEMLEDFPRVVKWKLFGEGIDDTPENHARVLEEVMVLIERFLKEDESIAKEFTSKTRTPVEAWSAAQGLKAYASRLQVGIEDTAYRMDWLQRTETSQRIRGHELKRTYLKTFVSGSSRLTLTIIQAMITRGQYARNDWRCDDILHKDQTLLREIFDAFTEFDRANVDPIADYEETMGCDCPAIVDIEEAVYRWPSSVPIPAL